MTADGYKVFQCQTRGHDHWVVAATQGIYYQPIYAEAETQEQAEEWLTTHKKPTPTTEAPL